MVNCVLLNRRVCEKEKRKKERERECVCVNSNKGSIEGLTWVRSREPYRNQYLAILTESTIQVSVSFSSSCNSINESYSTFLPLIISHTLSPFFLFIVYLYIFVLLAIEYKAFNV